MNEVSEIYLLETLKSLRGLKSNAEKAMAQITDEQLHFQPNSESNSVAIIVKHVAGNMISRFTDFLTTDGEKESRDRDAEFVDDKLSREELFKKWNEGWNCLLTTLVNIKPEDLLKKVYIRKEEHSVLRALQRQLAHYAYHTGQIVYLCKQIRSNGFETLSIARGHSKDFAPKPPRQNSNT